MRRLVIAGIVLVALAWAGVALAQDLNNYSGAMSYDQYAAGTTTAPVGLGWSESLSVGPLTPGGANAPVTDVKTELPQVNFPYYKYFPVCTAATINAAGSDTACPSGAEVGTGSFSSHLSQTSSPGAYRECNPLLDIWNGGKGNLVYYMTLGPRHQCDGFRTGTIPAWTGALTQSGSTMIADLPFPPSISTSVGGGLSGGLQTLSLHMLKTVALAPVPTEVTVTYTVKVKKKVKVKVKVHGKTKTETKVKTVTETKTKQELKTITKNAAFFQSTGCSTGNQRTFTLIVTAASGGQSAASTVTGTGNC